MPRGGLISLVVTNALSGAAAGVLVTAALLWSNVAEIRDLLAADETPVTGLVLLLSGIVPTFAVAGIVTALTQMRSDDEA